jgi:hypothetical protein
LDQFKHLYDPCLFPLAAHTKEIGMKVQIFPGGELIVERSLLGHGSQHLPYPARMTTHVVAHHLHLAAGRGGEAADQIDGGGLARSVGSQQTKDLSLLDREGEVVNVVQRPECFAERAQLDSWRSCHPCSMGRCRFLLSLFTHRSLSFRTETDLRPYRHM